MRTKKSRSLHGKIRTGSSFEITLKAVFSNRITR
ncbi:hypothetical protein ABH897_002395 [Paenibacillus sp. RC73]